MEKKTIRETVIVEGRDDTAAMNRAVNCMTIETHGFGISASTWKLIEKAYKETGIIIFTDPDFAGNQIRQRILERFPESRQAFLSREEARKKDDIGIENASPEAIIRALNHAHCTCDMNRNQFTEEDMINYGLKGAADSRERRETLGQLLGIGYGNSKSFLKKLNRFNISKEEFIEKAGKL